MNTFYFDAFVFLPVISESSLQPVHFTDVCVCVSRQREQTRQRDNKCHHNINVYS